LRYFSAFFSKFVIVRNLIIIIFVILCTLSFAQVKTKPVNEPKDLKLKVVKKEEAKFTSFGVNILEFNDANGLNINMVYGGHKLVRWSAEFHRFNSINIEPTWYNIKAKTYEVNAQFLARFKNNRDLIYPITGLSVNEFNGYFTGRDDFQNLREKYQINSEVKSYWIGMNFGLGYEHAFGPLNAFIVYKMRVGAQDVNERVNIMDVCYTAGLRYDIRTYTPKYLYKYIFRGYRNRYMLN
jgi:hypothetical protein